MFIKFFSGASHSTLLLVDQKCEKIVEIKGPGTNHFLTGLDECHQRIYDMITKALKQANLNESVLPLESLVSFFNLIKHDLLIQIVDLVVVFLSLEVKFFSKIEKIYLQNYLSIFRD